MKNELYPWPISRVYVAMRNEVDISVRINADVFRLFRVVQIKLLRYESTVSVKYWKVDIDFVGTFRVQTDWPRCCGPWMDDWKTAVDAIAFRSF